ncbi:MAG TPA: CSLREA domain-containing protein [Anaerolineae bacterium]|nr:CSLREA domain-containing protein [Anaerolineae bacterium]
MKFHQPAYSILVICLLSLIFCLYPAPANAGGGIIVVNTVDDADDGFCSPAHCSLREAINWANTMAGTPTITFDIPGPGPHEIALCHFLPAFTSSGTTVDGSSEPDFVDTPVIVLKPAFLPTSPPPLTHVPECIPPSVGLWIDTSEITVQDLSVVGFRHAWASIAAGIVVNSGSGNLILRNYLGIDPSGAPDGNRDGVLLGAAGQTIQSNAVSGNENGIHVLAGDQAIYDNRIGTNYQGDASGPGMGNYRGIYIEAGADGNTIGSPHPADANVISGNTAIGIDVGSDANVILNNRIGTNLVGDAALPNMYGVGLGGINNVLGGPGTSDGNLISGNDLYGVVMGSSSSGNEVIGNKIGTDLSGSAPLGNDIGVFALGGSDNIIGKNPPGHGNLIAHNVNHGVMILSDATAYYIGGNTITQNGGDGVILGTFCCAGPPFPERITLNRNSIHDNGELGVDLSPDGVTANDPGDADAGPNTLLNFPVFNQVTTTSATGTACADCRVEAFLADGDPSGHGEGMTFVGEAFADASGNFVVPLDVNLVSNCDLITARATDPLGNSSEFGANEQAGLCFVTPPLSVVLIPVGLGLFGLLLGAIIGRTRGVPGARPAVVGVVGGSVLGIGLSALAFLLPFIHVGSLLPEEQPDPGLPICDRLLDPTGFVPADGEVLPDDQFSFAWEWLGDPPQEPILWQLELQGPEGASQGLSTEIVSLPFSDFGLSPEPGSHYLWRLSGEILDPAGERQAFCDPTPWRAFLIGETPPPGSPPWTFEGPETPPSCLYTAIRNPICRESDYVEAEQVALLEHGEIALLVGVNPELTHGQFELASAQQCWISLGVMEGPEDPVETCDVPIVDPEPKPDEPPACSPDMDQEACEASGGEWTGGRVGAPSCTCP